MAENGLRVPGSSAVASAVASTATGVGGGSAAGTAGAGTGVVPTGVSGGTSNGEHENEHNANADGEKAQPAPAVQKYMQELMTERSRMENHFPLAVKLIDEGKLICPGHFMVITLISLCFCSSGACAAKRTHSHERPVRRCLPAAHHQAVPKSARAHQGQEVQLCGQATGAQGQLTASPAGGDAVQDRHTWSLLNEGSRT